MRGGRITPNWSQPELEVFDRYLGALRDGRYDLVTDAARDCRRELGRLRRAHPNAAWASVRRGPDAVCWKLGELARATGRRSHGRPWSRRALATVPQLSRHQELPVVPGCSVRLLALLAALAVPGHLAD